MKSIHRKFENPIPKNVLDGPPIEDGSRNNTLTKIAGLLHDGTRSLNELIEDLHTVNKARCQPPTSKHEVSGIAKSIHQKPACVPSKGKPPEQVLEFVERHWVGVLKAKPWKGQGGGSEYKVYEALLHVAWNHGWLSEHERVCVSVSVRELAMRAGVSTKTCHAALERLQKKRLIYRVPWMTDGTAGVLLLRDVAPQGVNTQQEDYEHGLTVNTLSEHEIAEEQIAASEALREDLQDWFQHALPVLSRFRHGAGRVTPTQIRHWRALNEAGGESSVGDVAQALSRRRDNVRRTLRGLAERGLVEYLGEDRYRIVEDIGKALAKALVEDGIPEVERAQRQTNERQREAYELYRRALKAPERRTNRDRSTRVDRGPAVVIPFIDPVAEVFDPEEVRQQEMDKNLPPKGADGAYHHGPECSCWLCDESGAAPEYIPARSVA